MYCCIVLHLFKQEIMRLPPHKYFPAPQQHHDLPPQYLYSLSLYKGNYITNLLLSPDAFAVITDGVTPARQPGQHPTLVHQPALLHVVLRLRPRVAILANQSSS